jgi:hypothetical protein
LFLDKTGWTEEQYWSSSSWLIDGMEMKWAAEAREEKKKNARK